MATLNRSEVNQMLIRKQGQQSLRGYAKELGISAPYLSDILRCNREPGPKILKLLQLRKIKSVNVVYERIRP